MILLRSVLFVAIFYIWSTALALVMLPLALGPRRWIMEATKLWVRGVLVLLRPICGITVELRGVAYMPAGGALIAAKHQCMFDTMAPFARLSDACYVLRRSLLRIPIYGLYCRKTQMIAIDREGGASALRELVATARARFAEARQVVIFPEGTRTPPGGSGVYKPGIAALYRDLGVEVTPMATNSGMHWPAHGFIRRPGVIVYEFLPPIPAGLPRAAFMRMLEERLETASKALLV